MDEHKALAEADLNDYWYCFKATSKELSSQLEPSCKIAQLGAMIINISSSAAVMPFVPTVSAYSGSKFVVSKIMECVHYENPDLHVFNLQPGLIDADMRKKAGLVSWDFDDPGMWYSTKRRRHEC
jgi:short-subunit dehydrogenase